MKPRTPMKRTGPERAAELREYNERKKEYLAAHPMCQITLARSGINEGAILLAGEGYAWRAYIFANGFRIPRSTQIHHRNKRTRGRLNDEAFWMACCRTAHEWVEQNKSQARIEGYLLPINSDSSGRMPEGCKQPLTTAELMEEKIRR